MAHPGSLDPPPPSVVSPRLTHTDTDVWPTPPPPYIPTPCMASAPFTKSPGQSHIDPEEWPTPAPSTPPASAQTLTIRRHQKSPRPLNPLRLRTQTVYISVAPSAS